MAQQASKKERKEKMRRLLLVALALVIFASVAVAGETSNSSWRNSLINNDPLSQHTHYYRDYERNLEYGAGLDVVLFETPNELFAVSAENRYDFGNSEYSGYLVGTVKIGELFKK